MANLITKDIYKQAKAITGSKDDERLDLIANSVSQLVKTYCANSFVDYVSTPKVEYFSPEWDTKEIQLTESPLIAVTEVAERLSPEESYTVLTDLTDYVASSRTDLVTRVSSYWAKGVDAVRITYTAGYTAIPEDLKLALIDLMSYYYREEHKTVKTLMSATMQNKTTSSLSSNMGFPDHIKRVLDLYRIQL